MFYEQAALGGLILRAVDVWMDRTPTHSDFRKKKKKTFKVFTFGGALLAVFISLEENIFFSVI